MGRPIFTVVEEKGFRKLSKIRLLYYHENIRFPMSKQFKNFCKLANEQFSAKLKEDLGFDVVRCGESKADSVFGVFSYLMLGSGTGIVKQLKKIIAFYVSKKALVEHENKVYEERLKDFNGSEDYLHQMTHCKISLSHAELLMLALYFNVEIRVFVCKTTAWDIYNAKKGVLTVNLLRRSS